MRFIALPLAALSLACPAAAEPQGSDAVTIQRHDSQPARKGPAENFTGQVRVETPFQARPPARAGGAVVSFEPGARTAWHSHPLGQTLIVLSGCGWVQGEGGPVEVIRRGDVVWTPPGKRHWHGAAPSAAMSHVAIAETLDGKSVTWMEQVSDDQYRAGSRATAC